MKTRSPTSVLALLLLLSLFPHRALSQTPTIEVESRLIVEDVLVTDNRGRPVHGLPVSAFHVFDQDRPETIRSFEEGQPAMAPASPRRALPVGTFSNALVAEAPTASEVLLVDADDLVLTDQMFLLNQLRRAITTLPPGLQVALFRVSGGRAVQIRGFSTDRGDLQRGLGECLPVQTHAIDSRFQSAVEQLLTVTAYLEQTPGRKNILWFAGDFPLVPVAGEELAPGGISADFAARQKAIHQIQESLAEARVSVYPVDVRGVLTSGIGPPGTASPAQTQTRDPSAIMKRTPTVGLPGADGPAESRQQMRELASATGGKAYMLNNLADEISEAFELGSRAYTLAYTPAGYKVDESWHKVRISVDGPYHLSYRTGYLATRDASPGGRQGFRLEDGVQASAQPAPTRDTRQPLLFTVRIDPAPDSTAAAPRKGRLRITLDFRIATDQVEFSKRDGQWRSELLICSYAYDSDGNMKGGLLQELDTALTGEQWQRARHQELPTRQVIEVPRDAGYLFTAVRDKHTGRIGTYLLPMRAVRALPPSSATGIPAAGPTDTAVSPQRSSANR